MDAPRGSSCPLCGGSDLFPCFEMRDVPVFCNQLYPTREAATGCARGDIALAFCRGCGLTFNAAFDPAKVAYSEEYENSLHFSARFQEYASGLADSLVARYGLRGKDVAEIGCGKGDFLFMLCEKGGNRGVGFDPSYVRTEEHGRKGLPVRFFQDLYSDRFASEPVDFLCSRHMLEHVRDPKAVLRTVRAALGGRIGVPVFFEVPNGAFTFRERFLWDIIYEHTSYFTALSLSQAFLRSGFAVADTEEAFEGQFLCIHAFPDGSPPKPSAPDPEALRRDEREAAAFADGYAAKVADWTRGLMRMKEEGRRVVVWGTGSKGVTFLNVLGPGGPVEYAVDINPRKQGRYVAGTGQRIVGPEFLREYQPDVVLGMNPVYRAELRASLDALGLAADLQFL